MLLTELATPALCVDLDVLERNIDAMASFFRDRACSLRPHFKAHKTPAIAKRQAQAGCAGFCCATVSEAEVLADAGFEDVLIANEVVDPAKRDRVAALAGRIDLTVAVDSPESVEVLRGTGTSVLVDVNVGLPRCGVPAEGAVGVARAADAAGLEVRGVMGYEGHATIVEDRAERENVARQSMQILLGVANDLGDAGFDVGVVSAGSTGTYDITGVMDGVTEVQAGSYVLMDTEYAKLGLPFDEGLRCLTTLLSVHGSIGVLDAGLKTLSVDHGNPSLPGEIPAQVLFLSDEHTTLVVEDGFGSRPGERMWLRPSHVDPTVNLHNRLYAFRGDEIVDLWDVAARGYGENR